VERLVEFAVAIPIVAYPVFLVVGTLRGRVRLYKCTVDARYDLRMRAAYPDMVDRTVSESPVTSSARGRQG
jgi:hypothetical protein